MTSNVLVREKIQVIIEFFSFYIKKINMFSPLPHRPAQTVNRLYTYTYINNLLKKIPKSPITKILHTGEN